MWVKRFEQFISENFISENFDNEEEDETYHQTPDHLEDINQMSIKKGFKDYLKYLENDDFIYFVPENNNGDEVAMYRKNDLSLASDNYFAEQELWDTVMKDDYTWLSDIAKIDVELAKESDEYKDYKEERENEDSE